MTAYIVEFPAIFLVIGPAKGNVPAASAEIAAHYYQDTPQSQRYAAREICAVGINALAATL
jgi:hypothetical protein